MRGDTTVAELPPGGVGEVARGAANPPPPPPAPPPAPAPPGRLAIRESSAGAAGASGGVRSEQASKR